MKQNEVKVGGKYRARVSGKLVTVLLERIEEHNPFFKGCSTKRFHVLNLSTGRRTVFRSAAKLRSAAQAYVLVETGEIKHGPYKDHGPELKEAVALLKELKSKGRFVRVDKVPLG